MCVGAQCGKNLLFSDKIYTRRLFFTKRGSKLNVFHHDFGPTTPFHTGIPKKNGIWMPKTQE